MGLLFLHLHQQLLLSQVLILASSRSVKWCLGFDSYFFRNYFGQVSFHAYTGHLYIIFAGTFLYIV